MQIASLKISGFRCFGFEPTSIQLDQLTTFVGPNASGKTAAMMALGKLFGETSSHRQVVPSDFHLRPNEDLKDQKTRTLSIECFLRFPELEHDDGATGDAVPETFNQMIVSEPEGTPYCRMRLEATWTDDGTTLGDIEQKLEWILTESDDPKVIENGNRRKVMAADRGRIRVLYVPAARDPDKQIRGTTATLFGNLLKSISWGGTGEKLKQQLAAIQTELSTLPGLSTVNSEVQNSWQKVYLGRVARNVSFRAIEEEPESLLKLLAAAFDPGEDGRSISTSDLSDGLRSLFSLSLSLGLFAVERKISADALNSGFNEEIAGSIPILTVFAVEEPENHLSPHYLGHVVSQLERIAADDAAQVVLSSHSPSILARVQPDNVRYFRGDEKSTSSYVAKLPLPSDQSDESFKFVREAIRGFPELYFSNLVILGEGPSEEIVLKKIFEVYATPLDAHFISIVPLGGRHVNHFWKLLHGLDIPFLTLLDLDREKEGAGWGRIQYVRDQLVERFGTGSPHLIFKTADGDQVCLSDSQFDILHQNSDADTATMENWACWLEKTYDVFFSRPLDLDLSLLEAFPETYKSLVEPPQRGPNLPAADEPGYPDAIDNRVKQVLAADIKTASATLGGTYSPTQRELFPWYKYFFIDGSKPVTHMRAMIKLDSTQIEKSIPGPLASLITRAQILTSRPSGNPSNATHQPE